MIPAPIPGRLALFWHAKSVMERLLHLLLAPGPDCGRIEVRTMQPTPRLDPGPATPSELRTKAGWSAAEIDPRLRAQESFDVGVWAALDLCRQSVKAAEKYNPFEAFEQRIILLALRSTGGNQLQAAKLLGISRSTLRKRMKKHRIQVGMRIVESA
jgi:transcriptional regulator with AAA-type ATPase domain